MGSIPASVHSRIPIPKLTHIEHYINLVEAWRQVDISDLHTLLPNVKVVPFELAQPVGWTPENAFLEFNCIIQQEHGQDTVAQEITGAPMSKISSFPVSN